MENSYTNPSSDELANLWKNKTVNDFLRTRITERQGLTTIVKDKDLIKEYSKMFHEALKEKDKFRSLTSHPGLTKKDYEKCIEIRDSSDAKKYRYSFISTGFTLFIYSTGIRRNYRFYNFFMGWNWFGKVGFYGKRIVSTVLLYNLNLAFWDYFYNTKITADILDLGLFTKYKLDRIYNLKHVEEPVEFWSEG